MIHVAHAPTEWSVNQGQLAKYFHLERRQDV
jgi:hypothetical protein